MKDTISLSTYRRIRQAQSRALRVQRRNRALTAGGLAICAIALFLSWALWVVR